MLCFLSQQSNVHRFSLLCTGQVDPNLDPVIGKKSHFIMRKGSVLQKYVKILNCKYLLIGLQSISSNYFFMNERPRLCFFVLSILHLGPLLRSHFYCKNTKRNSILCESIKQNSLVSSKQLLLVYTFMEQVFIPEIKISSILSVWNSTLLVQQSGPSGPSEEFIATVKNNSVIATKIYKHTYSSSHEAQTYVLQK